MREESEVRVAVDVDELARPGGLDGFAVGVYDGSDAEVLLQTPCDVADWISSGYY